MYWTRLFVLWHNPSHVFLGPLTRVRLVTRARKPTQARDFLCLLGQAAQSLVCTIKHDAATPISPMLHRTTIICVPTWQRIREPPSSVSSPLNIQGEGATRRDVRYKRSRKRRIGRIIPPQQEFNWSGLLELTVRSLP